MTNIRLFSPISLACITIVTGTLGQTRDTSSSNQPELEDILEESTTEREDSQVLDNLTVLLERPLDLNGAGIEQLQQIPGVDAALAGRILHYRETNEFNSINELIGIEGIDQDLLERIRHFIVVKKTILPRQKTGPSFSVVFRTRASHDLQRRKGFLDGAYLGTPLKLYNRLLVHCSNIGDGCFLGDYEAGVVQEKDAGERELDSFIASYIRIRLAAVPLHVVLGDFVVETGQGLVLWSGADISKGADVMAPARKIGIGVRPYRSTDESSFFRGIGVTVDLGWIAPTVFYSNKPLSGSLNHEGEITSLSSDGLFRTEAERNRKSISRERVAGMSMTTRPFGGFRFELSGFHSNSLHPLLTGGLTEPVKEVSVGGAGVSWSGSRLSVFGEIARDRSRSIAAVAGAVVRPSQEISVVLIGRRYPLKFENHHNYGFGESGGTTRNESGLYTALTAAMTSWFDLSASYDQFRFPGRTSSSDVPSSGNDFMVRGELKLSRSVKIELRFKQQEKPVSVDSPDPFMRSRSVSGERRQQKYRGMFQFVPTDMLRWQSRIEIVQVRYSRSDTREKGVLVFQDLRTVPFPGLLLSGRLVIFDTDSFDSRIYEFETDVRGAVFNPALYGKGMRYYIVARYECAEALGVEVKYGVTIKESARTIGTGLNEIVGDAESRLTVQCTLSF